MSDRCNYQLDPPRAQQKVWYRRRCKRLVPAGEKRCWQHKVYR